MSLGECLSENQIAEFHRDGMLVVPDFYDLDVDVLPIQRAIHLIIGQVMKRHDIPDRRIEFSVDRFDDGYQELITLDRSYGGEIYDAVKQIPAFVRLLADPRHEELFGQLRKGSIPGIAAGGYGIRIDNPDEDRFRVSCTTA